MTRLCLVFSRPLTDLCEWWAVERRGWPRSERGAACLQGDVVWAGGLPEAELGLGGGPLRLDCQGMQHNFVKSSRAQATPTGEGGSQDIHDVLRPNAEGAPQAYRMQEPDPDRASITGTPRVFICPPDRRGRAGVSLNPSLSRTCPTPFSRLDTPGRVRQRGPWWRRCPWWWRSGSASGGGHQRSNTSSR